MVLRARGVWAWLQRLYLQDGIPNTTKTGSLVKRNLMRPPTLLEVPIFPIL